MEYDIKSGSFIFGKEENELILDSLGGTPSALYETTKLELEAMDEARKNLSKYPPEKRKEFEEKYQERVEKLEELKQFLKLPVSVLDKKINR